MVNSKNILAVFALALGLVTQAQAKSSIVIEYGSKKVYWQWSESTDDDGNVQVSNRVLRVRTGSGSDVCNYIWTQMNGPNLVVRASRWAPTISWPGTPWYAEFPKSVWDAGRENYEHPDAIGMDYTDLSGAEDLFDPEGGGFEPPDPTLQDSDGDGWLDDYEEQNGSDPNDGTSVPTWDGWQLEDSFIGMLIEGDPDQRPKLHLDFINGDQKLDAVVYLDDNEPIDWMYGSGSDDGVTTGNGWPTQLPSSLIDGIVVDQGLDIVSPTTSGTNNASNPGGGSSFNGVSPLAAIPDNRDSSGETGNTSGTTEAVEALRDTNQKIANDLYKAERATAAEVKANRGVLNSVGRAQEDTTNAVNGVTDAVNGVTDAINGLGDGDEEGWLSGLFDSLAETLMGAGDDVYTNEIDISGLVQTLNSKFPTISANISSNSAYSIYLPFKFGWYASWQYVALSFKPDTSTALGSALDNARYIMRNFMILALLYKFFGGVITALRQW